MEFTRRPVARTWIVYHACGATGVGFLSLPSSGAPVALIPQFLAAAAFLWAAAITRARRIAVIGFCMFALTAWARAFTIWGTIGRAGSGSVMLPTFLWMWIAAGQMLSAVIIERRGVK